MNKNFICCPEFCCCNKTFFPVLFYVLLGNVFLARTDCELTSPTAIFFFPASSRNRYSGDQSLELNFEGNQFEMKGTFYWIERPCD